MPKIASSPRSRGQHKPVHTSTPKKLYRPRKVSPAPLTQQYLSLCEVSAEFGGSTWTWRHRCLNGAIDSVKLAGEKSKLLIPRKAIEQFFQRGYRPAVGSEVATV